MYGTKSEMQDQLRVAVRGCADILDKCQAKNRPLTKAEIKDFDRFEVEQNSLDRALARLEKDEYLRGTATRKTEPIQPTTVPWGDDDGNRSPNYPKQESRADKPGTKWVSAGGVEVRSYGKHERIAPQTEAPLSIGRMIVGKVTGSWKDAEGEERALSGGVNSAGGFMIPNPLSLQFVDLLRAKSVLAQAGMTTIPMAAETLDIARQTSEATFSSTGENTAIAESDPVFDRLTFTSRKIAGLIRASRELVEDAPNASQLIERGLINGLTAEIDRLGIQGNGGQEMVGIINQTGINATDAAVGALVWDDLLSAIRDCRIGLAEPNAYIVSPTNLDTLEKQKTGDAVNAAANYLAAPPSVARLQQEVTTNIADATVVVGDFTQLLMGLRTDVRVEVSTEANTAFTAHQVLLKVTMRLDFNVAHPTSFALLSGIS